MPANDFDIVRLTAALYDESEWKSTFDLVTPPEQSDGVCWALKRLLDRDLIIFRGSETPQDWLRDFRAEALWWSRRFASLGILALGFWEGMETSYDKIVPLLRSGIPAHIAGHSLGAARATEFAAMLTATGHPVDWLTVFGTPRPGIDLGPVLSACKSLHLYRNGNDLVCDVPTQPPFRHIAPFILLNEPPEVDDEWGPFSHHHIQLYMAGIAKLYPAA